MTALRRHCTLDVVVAAMVFVVACLFVRGGLLSSERFGDVGLYATDAHRMLNGDVPYRDFFFEYPPGSLAVFIAPAIVSLAHYTLLFKVLMTILGVAVLLVVGRLSSEVEQDRRRRLLALTAIALAPVLVGPLLMAEYDLWPTLTTVVALFAFMRGKNRVGAGLLGLGAATKIFPAAILPAALVWVYRRSGRRAALQCLAVAVAVAAATYAVFVVLAPGGVWFSIDVHLRRGLQKESLGSSVLFALDQLGLYKARIIESNPSWTELTGAAGDTLSTVSSLCQVAVSLGVAALLVRRRPEPRTLLYAAAAALAGFVAFGKVFSPQYVIWLVPLVALAGGLVENVLLGVALVLTQLWFLRIVTPFDLDSAVWLVVLRNVLVLGVFLLLARRLLRVEPIDRSPAPRTAPRAPDSVREAPT
jgi:hypothetical protein